MLLLTGSVNRIYFRYLAAAFGNTMISSIYSIFDMAMVRQYQEPEGTAALAVIAPIWNVIYSLGLLTGIGVYGGTARKALTFLPAKAILNLSSNGPEA